MNSLKAPAILPKMRFRVTLLILLTAGAFALIQFWYAIWLNKLYYTSNAPFYDSMSYMDQLFNTWDTTINQGFFAGIQKSASGTTCLPFIIIPLLADFVNPSRGLGIAFQSLWVFALYASTSWFFINCKKSNLLVGLCAPIPFVSIFAIYFYNGGISDFRMDLQMYLLFGLSVICFLIARSSKTRRCWILLGIVCGFTCLGRATAPVFLVLTLGPMLLFSWLTNHLTIKDAKTAIVYSGVSCIAVSGWFYLLNWRYLYYYYFIWNLDANANLPISKSIEHFKYAQRSTGNMIYLIFFILLILIIIEIWPKIFSFIADSQFEIKKLMIVDWAIIFPVMVPAGFLMLRGAGLNPFVSMPSSFGIVLIIILASASWRLTKIRAYLAVPALIIPSLSTALTGISSHTVAPGNYNQISGYQKAWSIITNHTPAGSRASIKISQLGAGYYSNLSLLNHLTFDAGLKREGSLITSGNHKYELIGRHLNWGTLATRAEWLNIPGSSDQQKRAAIINLFNDEVSFLIVPSSLTAQHLAERVSYNYINNQLPELINSFMADRNWVSTNQVFSVSDHESYTIIINKKLMGD